MKKLHLFPIILSICLLLLLPMEAYSVENTKADSLQDSLQQDTSQQDSLQQDNSVISSLTLDTGMYVSIANGKDTYENVLVQNVGGEDYLFLPSNANLYEMIISYKEGVAVFADNGEGIVFLAPNSSVDLEQFLVPSKKAGVSTLNLLVVLANGDMKNYDLNVMQSANVAALHIKSKDPEKGYAFVTGQQGNKGSGSVSLINSDGSVVYRGELSKIKGRGNSTWGANKKPFQIDLKNATDLIQTGIDANKAKTWVLLANAFDPTLLRNAAAFDMAQMMGLNTPDYRFVDLYYDGMYLGSYLLCEKVEMGPGRVKINDKGYLVELDAAYYNLEDYYFLDAFETPFVIKSPDEVSEEQIAYITNIFNEASIAAANGGTNPITGAYVWDYVDMDVLARYYVFQELTKNPDGFISSTYFSVPENGKITAGPVWDYDSSFGFVKEENMNLSSGLYSPERWCGNFLKLPDFKNAVRTYMVSEGANIAYSEIDIIAAKALMIENSRIMNDMLWKGIDNKYYTLPNYNRNLVYLKNFINKRTTYLVNHIGK